MQLRMILVVATLCLALIPADSLADTQRRGRSDLLFGLGSITSQEAELDGPVSLDLDDGSAVSLRWRLHFTDRFALETDLTAEDSRARLLVDGYEIDDADADTSFFTVNAVFNLTENPISPYLSAGIGTFDHDAVSVEQVGNTVFVDEVSETGGLFNAAVGVDGRTRGHLIWLVEVRWLSYEFEDFDEKWSRINFTGFIGFHF